MPFHTDNRVGPGAPSRSGIMPGEWEGLDLGGIRDFVSDPLFVGGLGLLAGLLDDDTNFGESALLGAGLAARQSMGLQRKEAQRIKNEAQREALRQQARQRRAREEVFSRAAGQDISPGGGQGFGLLTPGEAVDRSTPGLDSTDMGLLSQAFPEQAGELLFSQLQEQGDPLITLGDGTQVRFSELPTRGQELVVAGVVPGSEEFNQLIEQSIQNGGGTAADRLMAEANAMMAQLELRREQRTERGRESRIKNSAISTARNLRELRRINERLEGTAGETGLGLDELRKKALQGKAAIKTFFGFGDDKAVQLLNDVKRFETLSLKENISNIEELKNALGTSPTEFEFEKFIETGPSPSNPARVNNQIILDQLLELKRVEQVEPGVELPEWVDEEIDRLEADLSTEGEVSVGDPEIIPRAGGTTNLGDGVTLEFID